jgi:uncharacterized membrane protein (DUF485 family)
MYKTWKRELAAMMLIIMYGYSVLASYNPEAFTSVFELLVTPTFAFATAVFVTDSAVKQWKS